MSEGGATEGADYKPITWRRIRWNVDAVDPRTDTTYDVPFSITIIDDNISEDPEFIDVTFSVQRNGVAFPRLIARVTILDDDGGQFSMYFKRFHPYPHIHTLLPQIPLNILWSITI